ncbi:MAG: FAD-binding oxidoreductase [Gammaproteobacteria bacterium]|nr:FAD-binding oxidoreductase [Gammaproteobacteria bacterium]
MLKKLNFLHLLFEAALIILFSPSSFAVTLNDNGRINATQVSRIIRVKSETDILNAIKKAHEEHIPIAIMGKQHSQGGQSLASNAIELDMLSFNRVLKINTQKKQVTVQSGITWSDLQKYINPYNLAIKSMQSPNIFTVGGSMSVNAHGDDFRAGAVGNSIVAFDILLANGQKVSVTPTTNPKLWSAVIGGYGLFGVITNITLQLTDNNLLVSHYQKTNVDNFPVYFREKILNNKDVTLFYAHLNIIPHSSFLQDMYVITYTDTKELSTHIISLDNPDKWNVILTPIFNISRHGELGKKVRWNMEKRIFRKIYNNHVATRNNAMEKPVKFASDYYSKYNADWLQEYFIPLDQFPQFIKILSSVILKNNVNLLNVTIRYVPTESNILLPYVKNNCFAIVLYFNQDLSGKEVEHTKLWTRKLIDTTLSMDGNYYLPYQNFASESQFKQAYPGYEKIIELKKIYDPKNIFTNKLYQIYFK